MISELRLVARSLVRSPGFTAVVTATLALGVGATTAIYSVVDGVLLRPLPWDESERVMTLWESNPRVGADLDRVAAATFMDWREGTRSFEAMAAYQVDTYLLGGRERPEQVRVVRASPDFLDVVGVPPRLGRAFDEREEAPGGERVALLSHGFWTTRLGSDPAVLGTTVLLDDEPYTVVGVMPPSFEFPPDDRSVAAWIPLTLSAQALSIRAMRTYHVVGRLGPGVALEEARADLATVAARVARENPETNRGWSARVVPALEQLLGDTARLVVILGVAAGLVLLIACVNVASLMLGRSAGQEGEFALRAALGAGRPLLVRRSLSESLALAGVGGLSGIALAVGGIALLRRVLPPDLPRADQVGLDLRVLGFALAASLGAGLLFGAVPALRAMRPRLTEMLQDGGRGGHGNRYSRRLLHGLVGVEVAVALVLLTGAGLALRSFAALLDVDPGFRVDGVVSVALTLPESVYDDQESQKLFFNTLVDRVAALPAVEAAGAVTALPMSSQGIDFELPLEIEGRDPLPMAERPRAEYRAVVPGYFEALGIPLVRGRLLDRFDREEGNPVMVLNETAAELLFPVDDPLGAHMGVPMAGRIEVVGIVGDVLHDGLDAEPRPEIFVSYQNFPLRDMHVVVRSDEDLGPVAEAVRREIARLDPDLPVTEVATLRSLVSGSLARSRFNSALLLGFAACALLLSAVGIYGVISYSVARRSWEIGMRMALGAGRADAVLLVTGRTLAFAAVGGAVGLAGAVLAGWIARSFLFGVDPVDPTTLLGAMLLLTLVGVGAAALPATRAARVNPAQTLRRE